MCHRIIWEQNGELKRGYRVSNMALCDTIDLGECDRLCVSALASGGAPELVR